ncbi:hypothetical protein CSC2_17570 [Clostridium zeae]|uniref:Uncharacterized protein n=1 Tax=Clostridium zeae TaxID=2759022 RepID=A0ABQ1E8V8_9CLOT|nr:hypothetical protein [Clostridium zeae]GFZ31231.1 hypothetical protein CSC2_17570 [Clostridium zeae]
MYGIPSWSVDGVVFPSTSVFMASTTNFTSIAAGYINGSTLAYEPVIVPYLAGNPRKIRFFNRSTGTMVTTPDTSMNFMLTISTLR